MEEFFKNGFNWMVSQFGASMQSVTERLPWGILLIAGIAALFLLYAGYTAAHFVARGKYKKQLAEDIDAFDESKLSRKAIGLDIGSVGIIVVALLFLTGHAGFWAENGAAGFALCALLLVGAAAVFKLVHELLYHACRAAVRRAYWELSAEEEEDEDDEDEDDEDVAPAPAAPARPVAAYSPLGGGDDVFVPRPAAEPVMPAAPPVDADALRPGILEEIRKLKEEEAPQAPMTEEEVLENLKEFGEEEYEEEEDGEESLGAILAETLQDADYDYEDMDQNLTAEESEEEAEPASEAVEEAQPAQAQELSEEPVQAEAEAPVEDAEPEEPEAQEETAQPAEEPEPVEAEAEAPARVEEVQEAEEEAPEETPEEIAQPEEAAEVAEAEEAPQPEPETEPQPEPARTAKQLGDEEILREIERLKNSKPVPPESKAAHRIAADVPAEPSQPAPEKPARKKAPTSEELIDQARLARQTADNSEESMKTMQQIALLLQKEREKKKRKTPEEQRRMNEALADLLRAIGKKDE